MELPQEIINTAQQYLANEKIVIKEIAKPQYKKVIAYTKEERELKKHQKNYKDLLAHLEDKNQMLIVLSDDHDFDWGIFFKHQTSILWGHPDDISFGGWKPHNVSQREYLVNKLIFNGLALTSQEALERQTTFKELAKNDQFEEMVEIERKLLFLIKFLPYLHYELLLRFNLELNPFDNDERVDEANYNLFAKLALSYLELNHKLMGKNFPLVNQLKNIKTKLQEVSDIEKIVNNRSIQEIITLLIKEQNTIITDPEIISLFQKVAKDDEPDSKKWNEIITLKRITDYCNWINKNKLMKDIQDKDLKELKLKTRNSCSRVGLETLIKKLQDTKNNFIAMSQQHKTPVTIADIEELLDKITKLEEKEVVWEKSRQLNEQKSDLKIQLRFLKNTQMHLQLTSSKLTINHTDKITPQIIINNMKAEIKNAIENMKILPPLKIFDYDLSLISEEIEFLTQYREKQFQNYDLEHYGHWDDNLVFSILLKFFTDPRDYPKELINALRKNDSIHTHQIANMIEDGLEEYTTVGNTGNNFVRRRYGLYFDENPSDIEIKTENWQEMKKEIKKIFGNKHVNKISLDLRNNDTTSYDLLMEKLSLGSGPHMLKIFSEVYSNTVEKVDREISKIEQQKFELFQQYPQITIIFKRYSHSEAFDLLKLINNDSKKTKKQDYINAVSEFFKIKYTNNEHKQATSLARSYIKRIQEATDQDAAKIFKKFITKEVKNTKEEEKIKLFLQKINQIIKNTVTIAKIYNMNSEKIMESINTGNFKKIRNKINNQYYNAVSNIIEFSYRRENQALLHNGIKQAMSFFLIGELIKSQSMPAVTYNHDGKIHLPQAWSLFAPKHAQIKNDICFKDKKIKLLGSSNMSGKTFWEKAVVAALLWTTATGHSPSEGQPTMPLLDTVLYFDRVTTRSDRSLSSFGEEIKRTKTWLEKAKPEKIGISISDEFASSTSPKNQEALYIAMVIEMIKRGQYAVFASHSHNATDILEQEYGKYLEVAHFAHHKETGPNGKPLIIFDHILSPKREDSEAIDAAEMLGLDKEIIKLAKKMLKKSHITS